MHDLDPAKKLQHFRAALEGFLTRLQGDRCILAAVLVGSLTPDTIWRTDAIRLWVIEADGVTKRLRSDGSDERIFRILTEDGVNIHAELIPRSRFRLMVEGSSRTAFSCSFFAARELVYCADESIESWFRKANTVAPRDQDRELLAVTTWAIHAHRHARRQLEIRRDLRRCHEAVLWTAHAIAAMEQVRAGEIRESELMDRAIERDSELFRTLYVDVISRKPMKKYLVAAIDAAAAHLDEHWEASLRPVVRYLAKQRRVVPLSEISEHFAFTQLYPGHLEDACEWLEEHGLAEKVAMPFKLTRKSRVDVEEPAWMLVSELS